MITPSDRGGPLQGVRILETSRGIAARIATMVLADQGADVVRIPLREDHPDPVIGALLDRNKTVARLTADSEEGRQAFRDLLPHADAWVEDLLPGEGKDLEEASLGSPQSLVRLSLPAFRDGDPRQGLPHPEVAAAVAGCLYARPLGAPRWHDLPVTPVVGGLFGANGLLAALIARLRTGQGQRVTVPLHHGTLFAQILQVLMGSGVPRGFLALKMVATPFMHSWPCQDGRHVYLHITLPAHNARMISLLEEIGHPQEARDLRAALSDETMRDPSQVKDLAEAKAIEEVLRRIFRLRPAREWEALLGRELCCIEVRTVDQWMRDSRAAGMEDVVSLADPELGEVEAPGPGFRCREMPPGVAPRQVTGDLRATVRRWREAPGIGAPLEPGRHLRHPLEGIRVADLSRIIAGPTAGRLLAEMGAEVTAIQGPTDLAWALSFHLLFNVGKRTVTIDFTTPEGKARLQALIRHLDPHALIQNYRNLEVARDVGVGPEDLARSFPGMVQTHLNAYGNEGDWQHRPGFEQVVQAVTGIQMTYGGGQRPRLLPTPVIDIGTGLAGALATQVGLWHRLRTGRGCRVETHLTWTALLLQYPQVAAVHRQRLAGQGRPLAPATTPVATIVRALDGPMAVAGTPEDLAAWLGVQGPGQAAPEVLRRRLARQAWTRPVAAWQRDLESRGMGNRVLCIAVPRVKGLVRDLSRQDPSRPPPVRLRPYPGVVRPLAFVRLPLDFSATPLREGLPPPRRGQDTAEVLREAGLVPGAGDGVLPYPENRPLLAWLWEVARWGWFAWRSGSF
ncbi:MAG TPA: CoA transferase [Myxococcota bacterium]|nr:CoA transferase [Myxococcota bacterium]HQK50102.1 CoA transferase [Myxococcota bacterium]